MADKFNVLIADFVTDSEVETPILSDIANIEVANAHDEAHLARLLPQADAMILFHDIAKLTDTSFAIAPRLRGVVRAGVGFNNVDLKAAGSRGIGVCNVPDYGTEEVADHAIALLLALTRHLLLCDQAMRKGVWDYKIGADAPRLRGKTLGIIGCGRIGGATAIRAKAFGLDVVFFDPFVPQGTEKMLGIRRAFSLDELLKQSNFLSLHCFLDEKTHHLINASTLAMLPKGAVIVNTARGGCIDQSALMDALDTGHIMGAGLDVFEVEPLEDERVRNHPKVILTPHSAFYSIEGWVELRTKTAQEVRRLLSGEAPRYLVNRLELSAPRFKID